MANRIRGEVRLKLGSEEYTLRPTFAALADIEDILERTVPEIIQDAFRRNFGMKEAAVIIWSGIRGHDPESKITLRDIGNKIRSTGLNNILKTGDQDKNALMLFLLAGVMGDEEPVPGKDEAGEQKITG